MKEREKAGEKIRAVLKPLEIFKIDIGIYADQILNLPELAILSDDQGLPKTLSTNILDIAIYKQALKDMLKANFKRVI